MSFLGERKGRVRLWLATLPLRARAQSGAFPKGGGKIVAGRPAWLALLQAGQLNTGQAGKVGLCSGVPVIGSPCWFYNVYRYTGRNHL
jgi:hypothetical protein